MAVVQFCFVDIKVLLSIYNKPWLIEPNAALAGLDILQSLKPGETFPKQETTATVARASMKGNVTFAPDNIWDAEEHAGYDGAEIVVLAITGPLMKANFCGGFGTASLLNEFRKAEASSSVKGIVLLIDSPGGTVDGTEAFAEAIRKSAKGTIAVINGMGASAAYWLACSAQEVVATAKTDLIGSIGTMIGFKDYSAMYEKAGIVLREYYATESTEKNKVFRDAIKGDGKQLIQEFLDPTNDIFISHVKSQRGAKLGGKNDMLKGSLYHAQEAQRKGLIDGITTLDAAISRSKQLAQTKNQIRMSNATHLAALCAVLGWDNGFEATSEGVHLQQEHLEAINQALVDAQTKAANLQNELDTTKTTLTEKTEEAQTATTKVTQLEAQVEKLKKQDAKDFSNPASEKHDKFEEASAENEFETEYDKEWRGARGK